MPLSEFLRLALENLEASKKKSCSANLSVSGTENNLVGVDVVPSEGLNLSQNDVMVPCLNDGLQDYFSEGSYGVKAKETSGSKRSSCDQANRYLDNGQAAFKFPSCKARSRPSQQGQTSRLSGISTNNRQNVMFGNGGGAKETDQTMGNSGLLSVKQHGKALTQNNVLDGDRSVDPVFASSSVGSGNSGDRVSYEETHNLKRKFCDIECECHSDDIQIESVGVLKPTSARGDTGPKKSRTAEVHNLSERRRRDRINEKMRALQELIPHCNKADKASMLDDAIQYLKNLQHQVQSMSMGAGLCMPQMMFAPGSQHMYPTHMPHYSPMGMGMGMSYPIFPVPSIQGLRIANFHTSVPRPPSIPFTEAHLRIPTTSLNLNSEDPTKRTNSQSTRNAKNQGSD